MPIQKKKKAGRSDPRIHLMAKLKIALAHHSLLPLPTFLHNSPHFSYLWPRNKCSFLPCSINSVSLFSIQSPLSSPHSMQNNKLSISRLTPSDKGVVCVISFEDVTEKDWPLLEMDKTNLIEVHKQNTKRKNSVGEIGETSKVLISICSEQFVDDLVDSSPCQQLLIIYDSLFILADIKEKHDKVNFWQGEVISILEKWKPFVAVFLYYLPALPFELEQIFGALAQCISPGARIIVSHPQGREVAEEQRAQYPDVVVSSLPNKTALKSVAVGQLFEMVEFVKSLGFIL